MRNLKLIMYDFKKKNKRMKKIKNYEKFLKSKELQTIDSYFIENLEKIRLIGAGGGGQVYEVLKKETYALKEMNTENSNMNNFINFIKE